MIMNSKLIVATVPTEFSKEIVYTAVGQVGEAAIGDAFGIGFVRYGIFIRSRLTDLMKTFKNKFK